MNFPFGTADGLCIRASDGRNRCRWATHSGGLLGKDGRSGRRRGGRRDQFFDDGGLGLLFEIIRPEYGKQGKEIAHFGCRRQMLQLLIKHIFHSLSHRGNDMIGPVEEECVRNHQADVCDKLFGVVVTRIVRVRVGLGWVGRVEFALDGGEIHGRFDDRGIVGDVEGDGVDWAQEGRGVFQFFQCADGGCQETPLAKVEGHVCWVEPSGCG